MDVNSILGLDKPLFCDLEFDLVIAPESSKQQLVYQKDQIQALRDQIQWQTESVKRMESEIENMKQLLEECKHLKLNTMEKKEYSQTYLCRLNRSVVSKQGDLLRLKSQSKCSKHDDSKLAAQIRHKALLEHLFGVKLCTKYSNFETVTIQMNKHSEEDNKENYFQMKNKSSEAWMMLETVSKHRIDELLLLKTKQSETSK